ncbi:MAG: hypothetical protein V2A73_18930 [Pseudomonadota bacterium]
MRSIKQSQWASGVLLATSMLLAGAGTSGCDDDDEQKQQEELETYSLCQRTMTKQAVREIFNGDLVMVDTYAEAGYSSSFIITQLVLSIVLNGIDFDTLDSYTYSFEEDTGYYVLGDGATRIGFRLLFAKDWKEFAAGDPIPYDFFDEKSWVTDVDVEMNGLDVELSYTPGPLYELVDGNVSITGDLDDVDIAFDVKTDFLAFDVNSKQSYQGSSECNRADTLTINMTTTPVTFLELAEKVEEGGFGISYKGTIYDSPTFGIDQEFTDAPILMKRNGERWHWEGTYRSTVSKDGESVFQKGFISNIAQNTTEYYCDENVTEYIGIARHALDRESGVFEFADGTEFRYGLSGF